MYIISGAAVLKGQLTHIGLKSFEFRTIWQRMVAAC